MGRRQQTRAGRVIVAFSAAVGVILAGCGTAPSSEPAGHHTSTRARGPVAAVHRGLAAARTSLLRWHLAAALSREVMTAGPGRQLIILGGLTAGDTSTGSVYAISTATGAVRYVGVLPVPVHDAAVAVIGGRALIFGGGSQASIATVQAFDLHDRPGRARAVTAGSMPTRRSDTVAVTVGSAVYVVGGYDGVHADAAVLATANGRAFTTVADLPVPVRYPAVAALGGRIYVFGGLAVSGVHAGAPVDVIQSVDPVRHAASVIGHLPEPVAGAAAVTLDGELFVAGGQSTVRSSSSSGDISTIWAFDPATGRMLRAGELRVPVSHAGIAVLGSTAFIVGGETSSGLTTAIQLFRPDHRWLSSRRGQAGR